MESKNNKMNLKFMSYLENENFARLAVTSFCSIKIKDIEILSDIKTAVSEAITNAIIHGYDGIKGEIEIECELKDNCVSINIIDHGLGIENLNEAKKPFFTTKPEKERSGMGFTVMESFMDKVEVKSAVGEGTTVRLIKQVRPREEALPRRA
jgi:stage II sporulation protein AB (anti-sigma F factor)